jgi:soluble lytic murein transglycosylase-like protein
MSMAAITDRIAQLQGMAASMNQTLAASAASVGGAAAPASAVATTPSAPDTAGTPAASGAFQTLLTQASANQAASPTGDSSPYDAMIAQAAQANGVDPALLKGLVRQESGFDPTARSAAGATGLTQLMPSTAAALGVTDATDPQQAIEGGARYLRQQLDAFGGDTAKALAAYNAGPAAVTRYGGVPPYAETQQYVTRVLGYANEYRSSTTPVSLT